MNTRSRTIASFFTVAMAAMLVAGLVTTQFDRPLATVPAATVAAAPPPLPGPGQGAAFGLDTFREIARQNTAGVVNIGTSKTIRRNRTRDPFRDFFGDDMMDRFFGPQGGGRSERQTLQSLGSGFIVDKDGYILTNRHVIDDADEITVTLANQRPGDRPYTAKLVGKDARTDVALLKIEPNEPLTTVTLGDSDKTEPGDWVMAIGNPFGLGGNSVTVGVVSFKGRPLLLNQAVQGTQVEMIQTDASINPGNSGGPLLNTRGEVIGINTMIITGGTQQSSGVGFAVPINVAKDILPQLREKGMVVRGWLGVSILPVSNDAAQTFKLSEAKGAVIVDLTPGSPAEKAGLKPEDVVVAIDGRPVNDNSDLSRYVASKAPGTSVKLDVVRGGSRQSISVTLGTFPEEGAPGIAAEGETSDQLGMTLRNLTPEMADHLNLPRGTRGVVVTEVAGGAADAAGLREGDVILSVNGEAATDVATFRREIESAKADGLARLRVRRGSNHFLAFLRLR